MRRLGWVVLVFFLACGDDAPPPVDAGTCTTDADCDDGLFCTGTPRCSAGACVAGASPCREGQTCEEGARRCFTECAVSEDADGDGARAVECGGSDCDDANPDRFPGNTEICDAGDLDEDCDPRTFGFRDSDGDGAPDARCCNVDEVSGDRVCGTDCDDAAPAVNPANPELCNGVDDDCDGDTDEGLLRTLTIDADGDGHGDAAEGAPTMLTCDDEAGYAALADDCDDADPDRFPGNPEVCDAAMVDEDCSGEGNDVEGGCDCTGSESRVCGTMGRCAGATQQCMGGMWGPCAVVPATEVCDGSIDEDCDGSVDEELTAECYPDPDNDGYAGAGAVRMEVCRSEAPSRQDPPFNGCPTEMTARAPGAGTVDCCDADGRAFPGQPAGFGTPVNCGGFDFDCDGMATSSNPDHDLIESCDAIGDMASCNAERGAGSRGVGWTGTSVPGCGESAGFSTACWWISGCGPLSSWPTVRPCR